MAGLAVATDGDELDVEQAGALDSSAGDDSLAVGQQDDLEHDARVISTGADLVILEARIQGRQVKLVVNQIVEREGETAWDDLLG